MKVLHASGETAKEPGIRLTRYTKDFSWGFYCTENYEQAKRWALKRSPKPTINYYKYQENPDLKVLKFEGMTDEWLDFITDCRRGIHHKYDVVEGPMADDKLWNFIDDYLEGLIEREAFFTLCKF